MNKLADRQSLPLSLSPKLLLFAGVMALASPPTRAQDFDLRWGGHLFDVFTIDGVEAWTVEDGGRIRHRDSAGNWTFQTVPNAVKDKLHRIFFLPGTSGA
jgi:hypothetical protein